MEQFVYHGNEQTPYTVEIVDVDPALAQAWLNTNVEKYLKTERCLDAFVNHERMSRLFAAPRELFPLDEDESPIDLTLGASS